ncbi:MAG: insulinase family protein [Candidatus Gastranaerophilales bacterium]|nr:insulinase family protein [Candidatus Gastranaerophilales bacterium]
MHNYTNYNHSFTSGLEAAKIDNAKQIQNNTPEVQSQDTPQITEMSTVTPDFNVTVPTGYSKTGVEKLSNGQEIHCYKLNNGQKVYIAPKESAMTTLNTYVNTGAMNEKDEERGISHFCEHMAFNGTKGTDGYMKLGIGDVFRKVGDMGGNTNASTNFAETNYTISIPQFNKSDFETIVKMQSSMMNNLEMSEDMVSKEHGPVTSEINMYSDMSDCMASDAAIKNLYNIQSTSKDIVAGTVDNILNVDSKKVMDYYKNNYYPANMTTVVTGDVNPDEAIEIIAKNFRGENPKNPDRRFENLKPIQKTVRTDIISNKATATTGVVCFNGPANNDPRGQIVIEAVNTFLFNKKNSKSDKDLDDYNVSISAVQDKISAVPTDGKLLNLSFDSTEETSEIALKSIFNNLANFKAPTDEEMETLKTSLKMNYEKSYEDMEDLNYMIGRNSLMGDIDGCTQAINIIDNLTPQDMVDAVSKYYDINKASIAVVHPEKATMESISVNHDKAKTISFTGLNTVDKTDKNQKIPLKVDEIDRYQLPNNIDVAITESKSDIVNYTMNISTIAPANTKPGVMEVLSAILRKGSKEQRDLMDKNNTTVFSGATGKSIYYEAELPVKNLASSLSLMKDLVINPAMLEEDFEKSKKEVKDNLLTQHPNAFDNMGNTLFPDSPRGYTKKDVLDNIDNVTLAEVKGMFQYLKDNGAITFAVSMPTSKYPETKTVLNRELSTIETVRPNNMRMFNDFAPIEKSKVITDTANTAQADIVQAYKFYNTHTPKDLVIYELMNGILSSGDETGLFNNLREKQKLAYSVHSSCNLSPLSSSTLTCRILTTTDSEDMKSYDNVQKSINGFHNQINKMVNGEFTDKEIETAKLNYKRYLLESTDIQSDKVATISGALNSINGLNEANDLYDAVDTITREDIQNAAKYVFSQKPVYSIRASKDTLDANKEFLASLENN